MNNKQMNSLWVNSKFKLLLLGFFIIISASLAIILSSQAIAESNETNDYPSLILNGDGGEVWSAGTQLENWKSGDDAIDYIKQGCSDFDLLKVKTTNWPKDREYGADAGLIIRAYKQGEFAYSISFYGDCEEDEYWECGSIGNFHDTFVDILFDATYYFYAPDTSGPVSVLGTITLEDEPGTPAVGAMVQYCMVVDSEIVPVTGMATVTNIKGKYILRDIDADNMFPGVIKVGGGYYTTVQSEIIEDPGDLKPITINLEINENTGSDQSNFYIIGGEHHNEFNITYSEFEDGVLIDSETYTSAIVDYEVPLDAKYSVDENNNIKVSYFKNGQTNANTEVNIEAAPIAQDGYTFDKWFVSGNNLVIGQVYEIQDKALGFAMYKSTSDIQNINSVTAQTGDMIPLMAFIILFMLILTCFVSYNLGRKQNRYISHKIARHVDR